ncbi:MAG: prolyl oligopeptidase family serine peptidase [Flavobacteriaceae bacterium]|nr:prolyl oligopeptidase family serine peptidase [Bacteroidia bacterium]NNK87104.1 prolyl oligopeptidase family serine peptidase [Flavobacteriaceae bacterium]
MKSQAKLSRIALALIVVLVGQLSFSQNFTAYKKELFIQEQDSLPYRILLPKNFESDKTYPLILFLHGSGERGSDNELQLKHGASFFMSDSIMAKYPAIVVFPQCKAGMSWNNVESSDAGGERALDFPNKHKPNKHLELVEGLLDNLNSAYQIDQDRIYVGGLSMGGMGTFELVNRNPRLFAAAFPICGGAHPNIARRLRRTSWWIFHGSDDKDVAPEYSVQMYEALEKKNADAKITIYEGVGHESWTNAFAEPGLMNWLFSKSK